MQIAGTCGAAATLSDNLLQPTRPELCKRGGGV
jgi:hypothetical protein